MQRSASSSVENENATCRCRKIVLVGHDSKGDTKAMESVGFNTEERAPVVAYLDTQEIAGRLYGLTNSPNLRNLLNCLGLKPGYLHNACNDVAYTLLALLLLGDQNVVEYVCRGSLHRPLLTYQLEAVALAFFALKSRAADPARRTSAASRKSHFRRWCSVKMTKVEPTLNMPGYSWSGVSTRYRLEKTGIPRYSVSRSRG